MIPPGDETSTLFLNVRYPLNLLKEIRFSPTLSAI